MTKGSMAYEFIGRGAFILGEEPYSNLDQCI